VKHGPPESGEIISSTMRKGSVFCEGGVRVCRLTRANTCGVIRPWQPLKPIFRRWFAQGRLLGWTHLIVVCDTFDHNDYPMYASSADEARNLFADTSEMKTPMEVYNLAYLLRLNLTNIAPRTSEGNCSRRSAAASARRDMFSCTDRSTPDPVSLT